jgi:hypothetical protein
MAVGQAMKRLAVLAKSLASQFSQGFLVCLRLLAIHKTCGSCLPAMAVGQAMKRLAVLAQSLASQFSQGFLVCLRLLAIHKTCGSWLASDGGGSVDGDVGWAGPIAGKPAPTGVCGVI